MCNTATANVKFCMHYSLCYLLLHFAIDHSIEFTLFFAFRFSHFTKVHISGMLNQIIKIYYNNQTKKPGRIPSQRETRRRRLEKSWNYAKCIHRSCVLLLHFQDDDGDMQRYTYILHWFTLWDKSPCTESCFTYFYGTLSSIEWIYKMFRNMFSSTNIVQPYRCIQ